MTTLRPMPRGSVFLSWLILAVLIGGHWGILQLAAWTSMALNNLSEMSFSSAIVTAVDGDAPCRLCHAIQKAAHDEQPLATTLQLVQKLYHVDAIILNAVITIYSPVVIDYIDTGNHAEPNSYFGEPLPRPPISAS